MQAETLIIWPNADRAEELRHLLRSAELSTDIRVEHRHPDRSELAEWLSGPPQVVALIVGPAGDRGLAVLEDAAELAPDLLLAAADETESAERMRAAMRAGVSDYLSPPFHTSELEEAIERAAREARMGEATGVVVAFVPAQGGDGASTMALHAAYALANDVGQPALLIDCDLQCGTTMFRLHLEPCHTIADAQARVDDLDELWDRLITNWDGLHILPAPDEAPGTGYLDIDGLHRVVQAAARRYAFVIADLPPTLCGNCYEILEVADMIDLACVPALTSLHLARRKLREMAAAGIDSSKVRLTLGRDGKRAVASEKEIEKITGLEVDWTIPNDFTAVSDAVFRGELLPPDSDIGRRLHGMAFHLMGQEVREPKSTGWLGGLFARR